jgi:opacity protein-like surface antigen
MIDYQLKSISAAIPASHERLDKVGRRGSRLVRGSLILAFIVLLNPATRAQTQVETASFARKNTFGVFGGFSGNSSHMLMGQSRNRILILAGVSYSRGLFLNHRVNWQYNAELMPVALESDPVLHVVVHQTSPTTLTFGQDIVQPAPCVAFSSDYTYRAPNGAIYSGTEEGTCDRRWTMGQALSPIGMQLNFTPRRRVQPFLIAHGGYMYSTNQIPMINAGSFNFTFDAGAGIEFYFSGTQSIRAEYRFHHISNADTAASNPGIDNALFQVTYAFGR